MTAGRSSGSFTDTVTSSRLRPLYIRHVFSRSGNSLAHGAHHVAQKLISSSLPVPFCRSFLRSSAEAISTVIGSVEAAGWLAAGGGTAFTGQPSARVLALA